MINTGKGGAGKISTGEVEISASARGGFFGQKSGAIDTGEKNLVPYLPNELIGGSIPHISGTEEEAVWNAAAQACGTERVHYCYTIDDGRCWYLAVPSASLSSNPDSWCPLAAALPGNSEHWDRETVYLYEQEGAAVALRWDPETGRMQVFSGATRTILPRIQSMDANFVTINAENIAPIPWKSRAMLQERLSRNIILVMFLSGLAMTVFAAFYWAGAFMLTNMVRPRLDEAQAITRKATEELMLNAAKALDSNVQRHLSRMQLLSDILGNMGSTLVLYKVDEKGAVLWEALVPAVLTSDEKFRQQFKTEVVQREKDGRFRIRGRQ